MAFTYVIDPDHHLVTVRPETHPTAQDWAEVLDRVAADPKFRPGFHVLSNRWHLQVEPDVGYVRATIEAVADRRAAFGRSRFAVLTSHLATYGMARMAEALAENRGIEWRVFMDEAQALAWLAEP